MEIRDGGATGPVSGKTVFEYDNAQTTGNLTSETRGVTETATVIREYTGKGNVRTIRDAKGVLTSFSYEPICSAPELYPTRQYDADDTPVERERSYVYDCSSGLRIQETDTDNAVSTIFDYDRFGRLETTDEAGLRLTQLSYDDARRAVKRKADLATHGDGKLVAIDYYDQVGRLWLTRTSEDGGLEAFSGSGTDIPDEGIWLQRAFSTTAPASRMELVTNPLRKSETGASTMGWTRTELDSVGRVTQVTTFSGSVPADPWSATANRTGTTTTSYSGDVVTITDPANVVKTQTSDALGRLKQVVEDPGAAPKLNNVTNYAYNALDNLTVVCQGGTIVGTTCQNGLGRTFTYNSLSRLAGATNPESGDVTYEYDGNGNLLTKTDLRGVTTSAYDELNRIKSKSYSHSGSAATPAVAFCYDGMTYSGGACAGSRVAGKIGRLTAVGNSASVTTFTGIDALGRVTASAQSTAGQTYLFSYGYNLAGGLTSVTYPSGRVVSIGYDEAGRAKDVSGVLEGTTTHYTSGTTPIGYAAHGGVNEVVLGHGKVEQTCYNSRLQVGLIRVGAASSSNCADADDLWRLKNHYGATDNNGNVEGQTLGVTVGGTRLTFNTTFEYDGVNRLKMATEGTAWSRTFGYDGRANQWVSAWSGPSPGSFTPTSSSWFDAATNRMTGAPSAQFDGTGNQTQIGGYTLVYDAENRLKESTINSVTTAYSYDGDGRRVKKAVGSNTTVFVYDAHGTLAAEYGSTPPPGANTQYVATDHLGSIRMMTDGDGIISLHDYQPFGEEIPAGTGGRTNLWGAADNAAQRFTGKERDADTGLDYFGARHYSGAQGRFTSPDPLMNSGRPWEPQSWNRYTYTLNNPLKFTDPDGLWEVGGCSLSKTECKANQDRIRSAYHNLLQYAQSFKEGTKQRKELDRAIKYLGQEGDKNGVTFALGTLPGQRGAQFDQSNKTITFDLPKLDRLLLDPRVFQSGYRTTTEISSEIAHEGTHLADQNQGLVNLMIPSSGRVNWTALERSEIRGYSNESYVHEAAGTRSINQLWNPSWALADAEALRSKAVSQAAKESVKDMKAQAAAMGVK